MSKKNKLQNIFFGLIILSLFFADAFPHVYAAVIDDLKQKINERNENIKQLEEEINLYKKQVEETGNQAKSLQSVIKTLDLTEKKLTTDIKVTENKIVSTNLTIEELGLEIENKEKRIEENTNAIAQSMRTLNEFDTKSFVETILSYDDLSYYWNEIETIERFGIAVKAEVDTLARLKADLAEKKGETENKKKELVSFKGQLGDQQTIVVQNKNQKNALLGETKNKESTYKKILGDKIAKKNAFEAELLKFESQLRLEIDPGSFPPAGSGILAWPLDKIIVTQEFGDTEFSRSHAGVYSGKGHNGVDFGAAVGTPIKASLSGIIEGTGDTDIVCPAASYGRWVLITHGNGLSTLYAHLSLIKATPGQSVATGDIIGYTGNTGYSTGPHLHFTVYASQGVKILARKSTVCGGTYSMPIGDLKAYLNPLLYL